jgi:hypothetical protein
MASLLLENCDFSFWSKASMRLLGALNSTKSVSAFSFLGVILLFFGILSLSSLPLGDTTALLSEAITKPSLRYLKG